MKWTETRLFRGMSSLEMSRQIISMGLDGSLADDDDDIDEDVPTTSSVAYFYRSVLWRVYLNILSLPLTATSLERLTESWSHELYTSRAMYANKKQLFHAVYPTFFAVDEHFSGQTTNDSANHNVESRFTVFGEQLSSDGSASFNNNQQPQPAEPTTKRRYSLQDCGPQVRDDTITLDIVRTYLVSDDDVPHNVLFNLLSVWRWQHPIIGYHQGMVELAGFCVLVLSRAARHIPEQAPLPLCECANSAFLEADAYFLFDGIMSNFGLDELYHASTVVGRSEQLSERRSVVRPVNFEGSGDLTSMFQATESVPEKPPLNAGRRRPSDATGSLTTLERLCEHVVFGLLRDHSPGLFHHLSHTSMFDQLLVFLPRWLRNLFTRELSVPQLLTVWDGIFAVFYHEKCERAKRMSMRLSVAKGMPGPTAADVYDAIANDSSPLSGVVYAGAPSPSGASQAAITARGTKHFSRAVAGIAVAILLNLEEDLLNLNDAFSMLQRLTATPLLSRLTEPSSLVNLGFSIARCRPPDVIPLHRRQSAVFLRQSGRDFASSVGGVESPTTRLTKEELLIQQRSVALVVERVTERLHNVLRIKDTANSPQSDTEVRLSGNDVSEARGLLRELQCVVEKLSLL